MRESMKILTLPVLAAATVMLAGCGNIGSASNSSSSVDGSLPDSSGAVQSAPAPGAPTAAMQPKATKPAASVMAAPSASTGPEIPAADNDSSFDNLELVDDSLKGKLAILRVGSEPTPTNLLGVFAGLKNKTSRRLDLMVQTVYKDRAGNELNAGSWISLTLKPHEETEYHSASISDQAVDFVVRIRRAPHAKPAAPPSTFPIAP